MSQPQPRNILVVGADRGIAAAMVAHYQARNERVFAACLGEGDRWRDEAVVIIPNIDVTLDECIEALANALTGIILDVVVHVAGIGSLDRWGKFDFDRMLDHYNLNALGPLRVATALADQMAEGGAWGIVTSRMGSLGDNTSGGMYTYRMSKAAANMLGINLYHEFKPRGVTVVLLHPGTVATEMTKGARNRDEFLTPETAAAGLIAQLDALDPEAPPRFLHQDGTQLPW